MKIQLNLAQLFCDELKIRSNCNSNKVRFLVTNEVTSRVMFDSHNGC